MSVPINASDIRSKRKKKLNPKNWKNLNFQFATMEGSCHWKAWSARRGGNFHNMTVPGTHDATFQIRALQLIEP